METYLTSLWERLLDIDIQKDKFYYYQWDKIRGDLSADTSEYFFINDPMFPRFYLLQKIHKWLYNFPSRQVICNWGYYTENISPLLDYYLQPLAKNVNCYIKEFLRNLIRVFTKKMLSCPNEDIGLYRKNWTRKKIRKWHFCWIDWYSLKGTLMQIWKSANNFVLIWK